MAALAKTNGFLSSIAGAAMAFSAAVAPAHAQEATNVANGETKTIWTDELRELAAADRAATEYAKQHGAAILLHVGKDIQDHEQSEALLAWVKDQFKAGFAKQGFEIEIFTSMNDAVGTVLVYHVGDHVYTPAGEKDPLLGLQKASSFIPEVVEQARLAQELAQADLQVRSPIPGG